MKKLTKQTGRDFVILNLTDIHMDDNKMDAEHPFLAIFHRTLDELIARVRPDLITITGDLAWGGHHKGQRHLLDTLESFGIPWAPVFGNHDHDAGDEVLAKFEAMLTDCPHCLYESGDRAYGQGNYTILIEDENGRPIEGLIMLDSHQEVPMLCENGEVKSVWARLWENQIDWYAAQAASCKAMGCLETAMFLHIPLYGYREAWEAAFRSDCNLSEMPVPNGRADAWNPGYEGSCGVQYEGICSHPVQDGALDVVVASESTKYVFCGHDHVNNWQIKYRGVNLVYTLKIGCGAYWRPDLNGGTVIRVGDDGIRAVEHSYVTIPGELAEAT